MNQYIIQSIQFILLIIIANTFACFITNCPPGGKRSGGPSHRIKQCEQCEHPNGNGRCFGPNICCSQQFGCLIGTPETFACASEARFTTPCRNPGPTCTDKIPNGQCAGIGICCNSETCTTDEICQDFKSLKNTALRFQKLNGLMSNDGELNYGFPENIFQAKFNFGRKHGGYEQSSNVNGRFYEGFVKHSPNSIHQNPSMEIL